MSVENYFYDKQLRRYLIQFANIFTGLTVKTGKDGDGVIKDLPVPIKYGSRDRVVDFIFNKNTTNHPVTVPMLAFYMAGLELSADRRKGIYEIDVRNSMPIGGIFPDDLSTIYRAMPTPYDMILELNIFVSNVDQLHQVLEQVLVLFDPTIQIQTIDAQYDWASITSVELMSVNNEESYPMGEEVRTIVWTLSFKAPIWLSVSMAKKKSYIEQIRLKIANDTVINFMEFDPDGSPHIFAGDLIVDEIITADPTTLVPAVDRLEGNLKDTTSYPRGPILK